MKDMVVRGLSGVLYVGAVWASLWYGPTSAYFLFLFFLAVGLYEMQGILGDQPRSWWLIAVPALWYASSVAEQYGWSDARLYYPIVLFVWFGSLLFRKSKTITEDLTRIGALFLYPTLSFYLLPQVLAGPDDWKPFLVLGAFLMIWTNDTFAYMTGRFFGKRPLAPNISPNKTIEGLLGGVLFLMLLAYNLHLIFPQHTQAFWIGFGLLIGATSNIGDLFESWLKRRRGVKDSGAIMPGHGGVLDRLDSFIFSIPFIYVYCRLATGL